jgi:hypothetical protein
MSRKTKNNPRALTRLVPSSRRRRTSQCTGHPPCTHWPRSSRSQPRHPSTRCFAEACRRVSIECCGCGKDGVPSGVGQAWRPCYSAGQRKKKHAKWLFSQQTDVPSALKFFFAVETALLTGIARVIAVSCLRHRVIATEPVIISAHWLCVSCLLYHLAEQSWGQSEVRLGPPCVVDSTLYLYLHQGCPVAIVLCTQQ